MKQKTLQGWTAEDLLYSGLRCPLCLARFEQPLGGLRCLNGHRFAMDDGIPMLIPDTTNHFTDEHKAHQAEYYDSADGEFEISRPHGLPSFYGRLLREKFRRSVSDLGDLRGRLVLTVCGGSGMDAEFLARTGAQVIASDISHGAARRTLERSRRFGFQVRAIVADIERLPFEDRSIDLVYVHDGLHHLTDPEKGLREMARVARRAVSVTEPANAAVTRVGVKAGVAQIVEDAGNRVERLNPEQVERILREEGFGSIHTHRYLMYYRHEPGSVMKALSTPVVSDLAYWAWRAANVVVGRFGNKLSVQATRD